MCDTSSDNDTDIEETSLDTRGAVANVVVPERSKHKYIKAYTNFIKWKIAKNSQSFNEELLLAYFVELSDKFKPSSLWTLYSMLKSTLNLNNEVDISKYSRLLAFLKRNAQGCQDVKKSKTFTPAEINKFLKEAHNYDHLMEKVILIFGIVGACRRYELYNLLFTDVEVYVNKILVKICNTFRSTHSNMTYRVFTVTGSYFELCKKYISLRPHPCKITTFFLQYRSGKCREHPVGINQLGNVSKSIARYLELPEPDCYTGHCLRRTSTKLLVYSGGDTITLKEHSYGLRTTTLPEPGGNNSMEQSHNKTKGEPRNDTSTSIPEGYSNSLLKEINVEDSNKFPNIFENQDFECVNINIPDGVVSDSYTSDSMDSKGQVWNDIQNTVISKKNIVNINTSPSASDYNPIRDSVENHSNKVVNINIPDTSTNGNISNLQESVSALVRFNNCKIQNVNINYAK